MSTGTTTGRMPSAGVVHTGAGISALMNQAQSRAIQFLSGRHAPMTIIDNFSPLERRFWEVNTQDDNYAFGAALHAVKHPRAKEYHALTQRGKTHMRQQYEMAKHKELAKLFAVMKVTAKLEQP